MPTYNINFPKWDTIINERFIPLLKNTDRFLILYGGRGSSKSVFAAVKLIYRCMAEPYFRFVLIRNNYNTIKDSQFQTIKDIIYAMGLQALFDFRLAPMEIECKNGNKFIARGCDDTVKLKSIKDPTGAWYEEDIVDEQDFIRITTGIRTNKAAYLQEIFTINPEVQGDYKQNWFWKRFFEGRNDDLSFTDRTVIKLSETKEVALTYTVHHSTYEDNKWINDEFIAFLESMKRSNPYQYTVYCLGRWGNKETGGLFYKMFTQARNTIKNDVTRGTWPELYSEAIALHVSFDFNVNPYMTASIWQMIGKRAIKIDEICSRSPNNTTQATCRELIRRYQGHSGGMFIYGDPAGRHEDTRSEQGYNDYVIIMRELAAYRPTMRVQTSAPAVVMRGNFINTVFATSYAGIELLIGSNCTNTIADYMNLKEASDGTQLKEKGKDAVSNVMYEKFGHLVNADEYFICTAFVGEYMMYQKGGLESKIVIGRNISKHNY